MRWTHWLCLGWTLALTLGAPRALALEVISGTARVAATARTSSGPAQGAEVWVYPSRRAQQGLSPCSLHSDLPLLGPSNCPEGEDESSRRVMEGALRPPRAVAWTRTDARGHFRVEVPQDGLYQVVVRQEGLRAEEEGQASGTWKPFELVRADPVSGRVTNPQGQPVPRARVWCVDVAPLSIHETATDARGRYICPPLGLRGQVLVHARGHLPQWGSGPWPNTLPWAKVDLQLAETRMAWGTAVTDAGPVRGAEVRLGLTAITAVTDAQGRFRLPVWKSRHSVLQLTTDEHAQLVEVKPDAPVEDLRIPLVRAVRLTLRLTPDTGAHPPISCERVALSTDGTWWDGPYSPVWESRQRTGHTHVLGPVPAGRYHVLVRCDGWVPVLRKHGELLEPSAWTVPLRAGVTQHIRVVDVSGKPVPDVEVELTPEVSYALGGGWRVLGFIVIPRTNAQGRFQMETTLPGRYTARVRVFNFGDPAPSQSLDIAPGPPLTLQLPFPHEAREEERPREPRLPLPLRRETSEPEAGQGLEHCRVEDGGPGVTYQCGTVVFDVRDHQLPVPVVLEQVLPALLGAASWDKVGSFPVHEGARAVPGRTVRKVSLRATEADTSPAEAYWFGFELDSTWTRTVFCRAVLPFTPAELTWRDCDAALRTLPDHPTLRRQRAERKRTAPFEGCTIEARGPRRDGRAIFCEGLLALVIPDLQLEDGGDDAILDVVRLAFQETFHGTVTRTEKTPLPLAGQERQAVRYEAVAGAADDPRAPRQQGLFTTLPVKGQQRVLSCAWDVSRPGSAGRCQELLEALALVDTLPRANARAVDEADKPRAFAGRALGVPSWCTLNQPNRLHCGSAHLAWMRPDEAAGEPFEQFVAASQQVVREEDGTGHERERPCAIDGVETTCRVFEASFSGGRTFSLVGGQAVVRGEPVVIRCLTFSGPGQPLRAPCGLVLSLQESSAPPEALPVAARDPVLEAGAPVGDPAPVPAPPSTASAARRQPTPSQARVAPVAPLREDLHGLERLVPHGAALLVTVRPAGAGDLRELWKVSASGAHEVLARGRAGMEDLLVLREQVYWREPDGSIATVPLSGGEVRTAVRFKHLDVLALAGGDDTLLLQVRRRSEPAPRSLPEWALVAVSVPSLEPRLLTADGSLAQATPLGRFGAQAWFRPAGSDRLQVLDLAVNQWHAGPEWTEEHAPRLVVEHAALYGPGAGRFLPRLDLASGQLTLLDLGEGHNVLVGAAGKGALWMQERGSGRLFRLDVPTGQRVELGAFPGVIQGVAAREDSLWVGTRLEDSRGALYRLPSGPAR
jgi:hypothetical protein